MKWVFLIVGILLQTFGFMVGRTSDSNKMSLLSVFAFVAGTALVVVALV